MYNPVSTYRIQFHQSFRFQDLLTILPYLHQLGIKTIYASPVRTAVPGSTHGYDGTDPDQINPEIGIEEELMKISRKLKEYGMGWIQDIVPNHLAFSSDNRWLMDVLKKGTQSSFAPFFDRLGDIQAPLMVPFLGKPLQDVIKDGALKLVFSGNTATLNYADTAYPVNDDTQETLQQEVINTPEILQQIADGQYYRLCYWRETEQHINYRRFFTINGLICLNVQEPAVFDAVHSAIAGYLSQGIFQGLRIDHIDGLYDPAAYLKQLRMLAGTDVHITVEKILQHGEKLPEDWLVEGTTGYDFLAIVNNLLTDKNGETAFTDFYQALTDKNEPLQQQLYQKKRDILYQQMNGELNYLVQLFTGIDGKATDIQTLRTAIGELLVQCPVYRYYGNKLPLHEQEQSRLRQLLQKVAESHPHLKDQTGLLEKVLLQQPGNGDESFNQKALHFYKRCMQFAGPLMAKGMEDTLMYTFNRFIGHNEVGDSPAMFGIDAEEFHKLMLERQITQPLSLNATATHDTKRGEDARARLNVLTSISEDWLKAVSEWQEMSRPYKTNGWPDANDEYFIYQTLTATYPLTTEEQEGYKARITEYLVKALREAKVHTNWATPGEAYEQAVISFTEKLLDEQSSFMQHFTQWQSVITDAGMINSLVQLTLKCSCPGIPDSYQGSELWDFSLVDPDNRRPVDYGVREQLFEQVQQQSINDLWQSRHTGSIKLRLTNQLLKDRHDHTELYSKGAYLPLETTGKYSRNILAFARQYRQEWRIVAVPLYVAAICKEQQCSPLEIDWNDTAILLPETMPQSWKNLLNSTKGNVKGQLSVKDIFRELPVGILRLKHPVPDREAGILLSITSLCSPFGIGDMGPQAYQFADFLRSAGQHCWQLLPINPVNKESSYSPYSTPSLMAGNLLLISPELLQDDGLLEPEEVESYKMPCNERTDYEAVAVSKTQLLRIAFERFKQDKFHPLKKAFEQFCIKEKDWLDDYALYTVLTEKFDHRAWYEWPKYYRIHNPDMLNETRKQEAAAIERICWYQFIFFRQWHALRSYSNDAGIKLIGDLPFYAGHAAADVWSNPGLFSLDEDGRITAVAGVPPDYFSKEGQLWGMPTYKWDQMKSENYDWWIRRFKKNMELFDLIRIDHFRALSEYWEVPAGEQTAVNGQWLPGPGIEFFRILKDHLGYLPLIAEDLGDAMDDVYTLRDEAKLPGMKVVQFAFGANMPQSVDIPHNYPVNCIVYSGTHDNNTVQGWYKQELDEQGKERLEQYTGFKISADNINDIIIQLAYASVAKTVILPMQDILGLDETYRMNTPSTADNNWQWRMKPDQLTDNVAQSLLALARLYNRT